MKVYLSGPMRHHRDFNFPLFNAVTRLLREKGYEVINPAEKPGDAEMPWIDCILLDLKEILEMDPKVDVIATLPDWEHSEGAKIEVGVAEIRGIERRDALQMLARSNDAPSFNWHWRYGVPWAQPIQPNNIRIKTTTNTAQAQREELPF